MSKINKNQNSSLRKYICRKIVQKECRRIEKIKKIVSFPFVLWEDRIMGQHWYLSYSQLFHLIVGRGNIS